MGVLIVAVGKFQTRHIEQGQEKHVPPLQRIVGMVGKQDRRDNEKPRDGLQLVLTPEALILGGGNARIGYGERGTQINAGAS